MAMTIDENAFRRASTDLAAQATALRNLRRDILRSFDDLKRDWDSDARRAFFNKFDNELIRHLDDYARKLDQRSDTLNRVISHYRPVFDAANTLASTQYGD